MDLQGVSVARNEGFELGKSSKTGLDDSIDDICYAIFNIQCYIPIIYIQSSRQRCLSTSERGSALKLMWLLHNTIPKVGDDPRSPV